MSVNAVDQTTGNTTPLAGNTNNLVGNLSALTTNTKSDAVGAINEVNQTKQNATDNNLQTTDKTIVGGINELRSGLTNLQENGSLTFNNAEVSGSNYFTRLCRIGTQVFVMLQFNLTAQCNANTKIYTIPSAFIPASEAEIPLMSSSQGQLKLGTDGKVYAPANLAGNNVYSAVGMYKLTN